MQVFELKTQFKLLMVTMSAQRKHEIIRNKENFEKIMQKTKSVNPFLTAMFFKMSLRAWKNETRRVKNRIDQDDKFD